MRQRLAIPSLAVLVVLGIAPFAIATNSEANYLDRFNQGDYSGNHGSLTFPQEWVEIKDGSTGHASGAVKVGNEPLCAQGPCLQIATTGLTLDHVGAERFADTSMFGSAKLSYYMASGLLGGVLDPLRLGQASLKVEVTSNNGSSWTPLHEWSLDAFVDQGKVKSHPINDHLTAGFGVRFVVDGLVGGKVLIDDVEIVGTLAGANTTTTTKPSATTTTTKPIATSSSSSSTTTIAAALATADTTPRITDQDGGGGSADATLPSTTRPEGGSDPATLVPVDEGPPRLGNLRLAEHGLQARFQAGLFADTDMARPEVLGLTVDYRMAVEVIASSWVALVGLLLLITAALVTGVDRRRRAA